MKPYRNRSGRSGVAAYDSGDTPESAAEAYRKARAEGTALVLGPLFGASARALAPLVAQGGANVVSFSNDEQAAQRGVWIMGIAAPPQVRRVVDYAVDQGIKRFAAFAPQTSYGEQMVRTLEAQAVQRGITLSRIELELEGDINITSVWGTGDINPKPVGFTAVRIKVHVDGDADRKSLEDLVAHAIEWSPVTGTFRNAVPVSFGVA